MCYHTSRTILVFSCGRLPEYHIQQVVGSTLVSPPPNSSSQVAVPGATHGSATKQEDQKTSLNKLVNTQWTLMTDVRSRQGTPSASGRAWEPNRPPRTLPPSRRQAAPQWLRPCPLRAIAIWVLSGWMCTARLSVRGADAHALRSHRGMRLAPRTLATLALRARARARRQHQQHQHQQPYAPPDSADDSMSGLRMDAAAPFANPPIACSYDSVRRRGSVDASARPCAAERRACTSPPAPAHIRTGWRRPRIS